jgi:hypothetical protein
VNLLFVVCYVVEDEDMEDGKRVDRVVLQKAIAQWVNLLLEQEKKNNLAYFSQWEGMKANANNNKELEDREIYNSFL